ncbi:MAG: hypothetical protein AB8B56_08255 [Crocinitomicaceae bacterium]
MLSACARDKTEPYQVDHIVLKWHKSYNNDSFEKSIIGLNWALSHVGAKYTIQASEISSNKETIQVFPERCGLTVQGETTLTQLHQRITESISYVENGYIDIGHYVALLIGSSEHYYRLTNVPNTLSELESQYSFSPEIGYLNNSEISVQHRKILFSDQNNFNQLFVSQEVDSVTGQILEFETLDLMENGQPRFGVYDASGNRIVGAAPSLATAGKPGKCMWCHESSIQPLFGLQNVQAGYLNPVLLGDTLVFFRNEHKNSQNLLSEGVNYQDLTEHILMELLYISYMEPSAERLALEWNMTESEVVNLLIGLPMHEQEEFTFLGMLYDREDVENFAPYSALPVSSSVREVVGNEVNHLN